MKPDQLLNDAGRLEGIPGIIVQGRYDLLCPPATSHALAAAWHEIEIRIVEGAGHSLYDPGVRDAVMKSIADMASRVTARPSILGEPERRLERWPQLGLSFGSRRRFRGSSP